MLIEEAATLWFRHLSRTRTQKEVERVIRLQLLPGLAGRPLVDIKKRDMIAAIDAQALSSPSNAHHLLSYSRRFFNWACARDYLDSSPCDRVSGRLLIGPQPIRQRVLDDAEMARIWSAAAELGPFGTMVRVLMATGQRRSEVAEMRWRELSGLDRYGQAVWTIPANRFKSAIDHRIPLSTLASTLLREVKRTGKGELVFPSSKGTALSVFSKGKVRLDRLASVDGYVFHDFRRTMRTSMSALGVAENVAELCLGHGKKGLAKIYDLHRHESEMRVAFEQWAAKVASLEKRALFASEPKASAAEKRA